MPNRGASYRLTNLDASFLYQESAVSQMHGGLIFFLKGELSFDKLFHHIEGRLHVAPRYRQRLLFPPFNLAHPTLEDDPDFKLENHVRREQLAEGISEADAVKEVLVYNNSRLLDRTRPSAVVPDAVRRPARTLTGPFGRCTTRSWTVFPALIC